LTKKCPSRFGISSRMSRGLARATDGSRGKGNSFCPIERTDESSRFPQKVSLFSIVSPRAVDNDCLRKPFFVSLRRERAIHLVHESPFAGKAESYSTICLPRFVLRYYMQSALRVKSRRVAFRAYAKSLDKAAPPLVIARSGLCDEAIPYCGMEIASLRSQ